MNILFYRYGSICEEDILRCFLRSGHSCITIDDEISDKTITGADTLRLVDAKLSEGSFDCVFTVNFFPAISDLCNVYSIRYISWIVDSPVLELFAEAIRNPVNRVFVFDRAQYEDIQSFNPGCIFHYPLAVDTESKQRVISAAVSDGSAKRYACNVSFVGSLYTEKDPYRSLKGLDDYTKGFVEGLCEAQLRVYGYYFAQDQLSQRVTDAIISAEGCYHMKTANQLTDKIIVGQYYLGNHITALERTKILTHAAKFHPIDVYTRSDASSIENINLKGGCETLTEMPVIFNSSRINLNPTSKAIRTGVPLRVFDIFACEGFLMSNYQQELCELFVPGEDFVYYDSIEQVPDLIEYYLDHENERKEIAHNGFMKVKETYSYDIRLNRLLLTAFEN